MRVGVVGVGYTRPRGLTRGGSDVAGQAKDGLFLCSALRRMALRAGVARSLSSALDWPDDLLAGAACGGRAA